MNTNISGYSHTANKVNFDCKENAEKFEQARKINECYDELIVFLNNSG